jgi:hypothetical protein
MLRLCKGPRTLSRFSACQPMGTIWQPPRLVLIPDGSDPHIRDFRYRGPGAALVLREHERLAFARPRRRTAGARVVTGMRTGVPVIRGVTNARPLARPRVVRVPRGSTLVVRRAATASTRTASGLRPR